MYKIKSCKSCPKQFCKGGCKDMEIVYKSSIPRPLAIEMHDSTKFYKILDIANLFTVFEKHPNASYVINGGNTAHGLHIIIIIIKL